MSAGFFCREAPIFEENNMTDSDLIQKIHNGDQEAAGILIERYYADIYHFCLYMVQSEEDACLYHIQIAGSEKNAAL